MADRFTADILFIVAVLVLAWVLGFLVCWFLRSAKVAELRLEIENLKRRLDSRIAVRSSGRMVSISEEELKELKEEIRQLEDKLEDQMNAELKSSFVFDPKEAEMAFGRTIKENDLTIIEGIGPKIASILGQSGVDNWEKLADSSKDKLQKILSKEGPGFVVHKPDTWPQQAQMAIEGEWTKLKEWQDYLKGGVDPAG